jgi:hypothetical protein
MLSESSFWSAIEAVGIDIHVCGSRLLVISAGYLRQNVYQDVTVYPIPAAHYMLFS